MFSRSFFCLIVALSSGPAAVWCLVMQDGMSAIFFFSMSGIFALAGGCLHAKEQEERCDCGVAVVSVQTSFGRLVVCPKCKKEWIG